MTSRSPLYERIAAEMQDTETIDQAVRTQKQTGLAIPEIGAVAGQPAAPCTPTEKWLAETWCEFLGIEQVDIHTDFFELGGDSLAALRILSRVRETFQVSVPPTVLFAIDFTVAEIAKIIDQYQIEKADVKDIEGMLAELENLSDEEARALLANQELEQSAAEG